VSAIARLRPRPRDRHDDYVLCQTDGFWFRPAYTHGKCPVCGEPAIGGVPAQSFWRSDRSWYGMAGLALESVVMLTLVLLLYFR
jgi:hypothetical protein